METDTLVSLIVAECQSSEGFLNKLHVDNDFDSARFDALISYLDDYRTSIQGSRVLHREIAGCVFFVVQALEQTLQSGNTNAPSKERVAVAHAKIWEVAMLLFQ